VSERIAIDASLAASFALPIEDHHAKARALIIALAERKARFCAPPLFEAETSSIFRRKEYLGQISEQAAAASLAVIDALQVEIIYEAATGLRAREIAARNNQVRVYDSTYAALAEARGVELWTADERFYNSVSGALPFVKFVGNFK
jgi:predicted nucleic acid-binding protein